MRIEDLDDPRAGELTRLAHKALETQLKILDARGKTSRFSDHHIWLEIRYYREVLAYQDLRAELEKEGGKIGQGGWRNEGE